MQKVLEITKYHNFIWRNFKNEQVLKDKKKHGSLYIPQKSTNKDLQYSKLDIKEYFLDVDQNSG